MAVTLITPTAYARHRGCDEKAVRKAIAANRISTINGLVDAAVADIQWAQNTRARGDSGRRASAAVPLPASLAATAGVGVGVTSAGSADTPDTQNSYSVDRARRERYDADLAQLKLEEERRDLYRVVEIRAEMSRRVGQARMNLLQIPARLAPLLAIESDQAKVHAMLADEIRAVLTAVSQD